MNSENPFAPPQSDLGQQKPDFLPHKVFRRGNTLCIFNGAALPHRCFSTGKATEDSFPIKFVYRPPNAGSFFSGGITGKKLKVELEIPLSSSVIQTHLRTVNFSLAGLSVCGIVGILAILFWIMAPTNGQLPAFTIFLCAIGGWPLLQLASKPPFEPEIIWADEQQIMLGDIHPDCLASVPEFPGETENMQTQDS